ncbi:hypothetical protein N7499_006345 [Penicillium canescens]|nr:hypothetical protein N7499_006345 [Penicillium canescens]KAJ6176732.1 hypothetical protein N7485_003646 [Penicillium canescens]
MGITRAWSDVPDELGSETNPIVIYDDDNCDELHTSEQHNSAGSKNSLSTQGSWTHLRDRGYHIAQNEPMVMDSTCDLTPCRLICGQNSECSCSLESISCGHLEDERPEAPKSAKAEERASQDKSCYQTATTHLASSSECYHSWSRQGDEMESSIETSQPKNDDPPCQHESGGRKRGNGGEDYSGNRRSKRLANQSKK